MTYVLAIVGIALIFDFINGMHDSANSIATVVSTRVLSPRAAVLWAAVFNFIAFLIYPARVSASIAKGVAPAAVTSDVILATLLGFPISTTHALSGAIIGCGLVAVGPAVNFAALGKAGVLHSGEFAPRPLVFLTTDLPPRGSAGDAALRAARGKIYFDAIEMLSPAGQERLAGYAAGGAHLHPPGELLSPEDPDER